MTEQIKSAIDTLKTMYPKKCKMVDGRLTGGYDDYESEKGKTITLAIRSLSAWEEVLEQLKGQADFANRCGDMEEALGIKGAIDTIKQKLAEIEEGEKYGRDKCNITWYEYV